MVAVFVAAYVLSQPVEPADEVSFGQVLEDAREGRIRRIEVEGDRARLEYFTVNDEGEPVTRTAIVPETVDLVDALRDEGVAISSGTHSEGEAAVALAFEPTGGGFGSFLGLLFNILPLVFIGFFAWFIFRRMQMPGSQGTGFTKSGASVIQGDRVSVSFSDVAGVDEAKEELVELVEFLKYPSKFAMLGAHIPRGVLLLGPPGTGKTLLARAVAGEAGVAFFSISGSQFVELYVGVGAGRVRDLFAEAKRNAPCIIFLDEIDAVGRQRGAGLGGSHDEREQTLNQILVEMDGFEPGTNVVVIAATNRPDILDPALIRPGRFDRKIVLDAPDRRGREAILKVHLRGKPLEEDVDIERLAQTTPGFTGADLANLVNEAAILAARTNMRLIGMQEFVEAIDRVLAGPERKSRIMTIEERRLVAYHEGGHVVVAHFMENHDRPEKVTIVSRGMAAGYTRFLPDEEAHFRQPEALADQICAALGGRAAELLVFGSASTGPSNDLEQISRLARSMVTRWGMSSELGPITYGRTEELVFLGREISETRNYSESTAALIDSEVRRIVEAAEKRAMDVLTEHRLLLDHLAATLLERETLQGAELDELLRCDPPLVEAAAGAGELAVVAFDVPPPG